MFAEDENVEGFIPEIKVNVENPQRHAEPLDTYITYKITVSVKYRVLLLKCNFSNLYKSSYTCSLFQSNRADYPEKEYTVRRRYNDFLWLRNKLVETYPTRLIPVNIFLFVRNSIICCHVMKNCSFF